MGRRRMMLAQGYVEPIEIVGLVPAFADTEVGDESSEEGFIISGRNLSANLVITPPIGFKISLTSGSGFTTSAISLTQTFGVVAPTTIFVKFVPLADTTYNSNIVCSSTGVTSKNVAVSGVGLGFLVASGGTISQVGDYKRHVFTSSDNFIVTQISSTPSNNNLKVNVIAGGGPGGNYFGGGGGGAGGFAEDLSYSIGLGTHAVVIGAGGSITSYPTQSGNGSNSTFGSITAVGGGRGGRNNVAGPNLDGASGGSGGGAGGYIVAGTGGSGTSLQGNAGGNSPGTSPYRSGGGGGAGAAGTSGSSTPNGGAGKVSNINGNTYAGGGGGGSWNGTSFGTGGSGGGGAGAYSSANGVAGTANTGGGGGGSGTNGTIQWPGASGGSGLVIIEYYSPV